MNNNCEEDVMEIERYLRKINCIVRLKGREILNDINITIPQFTALQILIHEEESLTIGELSQKMALACSTITDLIDRMEKNKLVERRKDLRDKRIVRIEVMSLGNELVQKVLEKRREYLQEQLGSFNKEDKTKLKECLKILYNAIREE